MICKPHQTPKLSNNCVKQCQTFHLGFIQTSLVKAFSTNCLEFQSVKSTKQYTTHQIGLEICGFPLWVGEFAQKSEKIHLNKLRESLSILRSQYLTYAPPWQNILFSLPQLLQSTWVEVVS